MKTKPAKPVAQSYPTCGEVFYFWASRLELLTWGEAFAPAKTKARDENQIRKTSDLLRDWANETAGRVPERADFERIIRDHTRCAETTDSLVFVLTSLWDDILTDHCGLVRTDTTIHERAGTRVWYTRWQSSRGLSILYLFQKLLSYLSDAPDRFLAQPLDTLLAKAWQAGATKFPLTAACFDHYANFKNAECDPKSIAEWHAGTARPSFAKIGDFFRCEARLPEIVCAFGFSRALETLAALVRQESGVQDWASLESIFIRQARCFRGVDAEVEAGRETRSIAEYYKYLLATLNQTHFAKKSIALKGGTDDLLDIRFADYRVFKEHHDFLASSKMPLRFPEFIKNFEELWWISRLDNTRFSADQLRKGLVWLKGKWGEHIEPFAGLLLAIEARIQLRSQPLNEADCILALELYQRGADNCRYRAGKYAKEVFLEALGFAALIQRRGIAKRPLKPWIKNAEAWLVLIGFTDPQPLPFDAHLELHAAGFQVYACGRLGMPENIDELRKRAQ